MSKPSIRIGGSARPELRLRSRQRLDALAPPALASQPLLGERELGVSLGELAQAALVAALCRAHLDRGARGARRSASLEQLGALARARARRRRGGGTAGDAE